MKKSTRTATIFLTLATFLALAPAVRAQGAPELTSFGFVPRVWETGEVPGVNTFGETLIYGTAADPDGLRNWAIRYLPPEPGRIAASRLEEFGSTGRFQRVRNPLVNDVVEGIWYLEIYLRDDLFNAVTLGPADLAALGFPASFVVQSPDDADTDGDGVADLYDTCPDVADPEQRDRDWDGFGDLCDPDTPTAERCDLNADGTADILDVTLLRRVLVQE